MGRNGQLLREGAEALGVSHAPLQRNAGRCVAVQLVPERLPARREAGDARLLPAAGGRRRRPGARRGRGAPDRLRGRAARSASTAVPASRARNGAGRPVHASAPARAVVLAGGAFGTPELLLRSGFRSASGELGRNLRIHPACWVGARFDEEVRGWDGVMQSYAVDEWEERGAPARGDLHAARLRRPVAAGHRRASTRSGCSTTADVASTGVHLSDTLRGPRRARRRRLAADQLPARRATTPTGSSSASPAPPSSSTRPARARSTRRSPASPTLARERIADLEASPPPRSALRLEAFHPMGTARMDADPRRGVAGADGAVHGAERLYVADGQPAAELDRRQPDDDDHRDGLAGRPAARRAQLA